MKRLLIVACLFLTGAAAAAASLPDRSELHSAMDLSIRATAEAGVFEVKAIVTDLADDKVIASPVLLVRDGEEGSVRFDRGAQGELSLAVQVDGADRKVRYRSEWRVGSKTVARQSAQIVLP